MLELLSKKRTPLMGVAILWVMLYHGGISVPLIDIGYGGVDIFFFLSGFGLYFSSLKSQNILSFYKNRFSRVLPTYALVSLIAMILLGTFSIAQYIINISTIGFLTDLGFFEWYVPSLFLFYLTFPWWIDFFKRFPLVTLLFSVFIMATLVYLRVNFNWPEHLMLFFCRIPIFVIGCQFGKWTSEKSTPTWLTRPLLYGLMMTGLVTLYTIQWFHPEWLYTYGAYWYPFILITPGLSILIVSVLQKINLSWLLSALSWCGAISLELYLVHVKAFERAPFLDETIGLPTPVILLIMLLLSFPIAWLLSRLVALLVEQSRRIIGS